MIGRIAWTLIIMGIVFEALFIAHRVSAQEMQQAYTLSDPVRPDGYGLATLGGRYSISLGDACGTSGIMPNMNVWIEPIPGFTGAAVLMLPDGSQCPVRFESLEAEQPCFVNDAGECDIAAETE